MYNSKIISHEFKLGDSNDNVVLLQRALRETLKNSMRADGDFGVKTKEALITWQSSSGIIADGVYTGGTKKQLDKYISERFIQEWCYASVADIVNRDEKKFTLIAKAIASVESRHEGFGADGNVTMLFERHKFRSQLIERLIKNPNEITLVEDFYKVKIGTKSVNEVVALIEHNSPDICNIIPGGYGAGDVARARFQKALAINPQAAANSASFGLYQIMGFNALICGYASGYDMLADFKVSEYNHLLAFAKFLEANSIVYKYLANKEYDKIAKLYNGPLYAKNNYDVKLAKAVEWLSH